MESGNPHIIIIIILPQFPNTFSMPWSSSSAGVKLFPPSMETSTRATRCPPPPRAMPRTSRPSARTCASCVPRKVWCSSGTITLGGGGVWPKRLLCKNMGKYGENEVYRCLPYYPIFPRHRKNTRGMIVGWTCLTGLVWGHWSGSCCMLLTVVHNWALMFPVISLEVHSEVQTG